jgi:uncharacterized protein (DUF2461 family)
MPTKQSSPPDDSHVTDTGFHGFSASAFAWFAGLELDNSREYFNATRDGYEAEVRRPLTLMLQELSVTFGGTVHVFRQQNDMRFAPTTPYKTRTYGGLDFDAPVRPRLYADISARGLYAGTGYFRLASDQLLRYRDAVVDEQSGTLLAATLVATQDAGLELITDSLNAVPRGYPRDHARDELLKFRSLLVGRLRVGGGAIDRDDALAHVAGAWRAAAGLTNWLAEHVGPSTLTPRERWPRRPAKASESGGAVPAA